LKTQSKFLESKLERMNHLLRSFEGQPNLLSLESNEDQYDGGEFWRSVYDIDRELKKLFSDIRGRTSHVHFIDGYTNLAIDNKKLRMR